MGNRYIYINFWYEYVNTFVILFAAFEASETEECSTHKESGDSSTSVRGSERQIRKLEALLQVCTCICSSVVNSLQVYHFELFRNINILHLYMTGISSKQ